MPIDTEGPSPEEMGIKPEEMKPQEVASAKEETHEVASEAKEKEISALHELGIEFAPHEQLVEPNEIGKVESYSYQVNKDLVDSGERVKYEIRGYRGEKRTDEKVVSHTVMKNGQQLFTQRFVNVKVGEGGLFKDAGENGQILDTKLKAQILDYHDGTKQVLHADYDEQGRQVRVRNEVNGQLKDEIISEYGDDGIRARKIKRSYSEGKPPQETIMERPDGKLTSHLEYVPMAVKIPELMDNELTI
jgi:hypothetical protein